MIWVQIQTTASVLNLVHCTNGEVERRLEFADGRWGRVEGAPRAWESFLFSAQELERALEIHDDHDAVQAAFASRTLASGQNLPWPSDFGSLHAALEVSAETWRAGVESAPSRVLRGTRVAPITHWARGLVATAILLLLGAVLSHGDWRAGLASLGVPLLVLGFCAGLVRRAAVGRWFF